MNWLASHTIALALPLILGLLSRPAVDWTKGLVVALDKASPLVKQAVAVAFSILFAGVAHLIGSLFPPGCLGESATAQTCLAAFTEPQPWQILIGGLVAIALKHGQQNAS